MKKIILLSSFVLLAAVLITSCVRHSGSNNVNENYWLTQERGDIVFSDSYCGYIVVETLYGYTIIRSTGGYQPYEGDEVYGNFGNYGTRSFYNRSTGRLVTGEVIEYDLSYVDAQYAIEYYCPSYGKGATATARIKNSGAAKIARPK